MKLHLWPLLAVFGYHYCLGPGWPPQSVAEPDPHRLLRQVFRHPEGPTPACVRFRRMAKQPPSWQMAHIINLACEITEIHSRYRKIHKAVFGLSMHRSAYFFGRGTSEFYGERERELCALEEQLVELEPVLAQVDTDELTRRAGRQVHDALVQYTSRLVATVVHLKEICGKLRIDEGDYRRLADNGDSRFRRDKVKYDYSVQELRRRGAKMNELFSTF